LLGLEIYVPRTFAGHSPRFQQKVILAVEVTYADGYERHIVKVGDRKKVESDFTGWQKCTNKRMVASRIFAPVRLLDWKADRVAVLYRDAFTLFGPDAQNSKFQPTMLEEAILWVVKDDEPDLLSAATWVLSSRSAACMASTSLTPAGRSRNQAHFF
jgi:hypothetical protein